MFVQSCWVMGWGSWTLQFKLLQTEPRQRRLHVQTSFEILWVTVQTHLKAANRIVAARLLYCNKTRSHTGKLNKVICDWHAWNTKGLGVSHAAHWGLQPRREKAQQQQSDPSKGVIRVCMWKATVPLRNTELYRISLLCFSALKTFFLKHVWLQQKLSQPTADYLLSTNRQKELATSWWTLYSI